MEKEKVEIMVANKSHFKYVETILETIAKAAKAPVGEIPTWGIFADVNKDSFTDKDGTEHLFVILEVVDDTKKSRGSIPLGSIMRQVCVETNGKLETFQIKPNSDSPNKGKFGLKSERLNADFISGSEVQVISDLLGRKFSLEVVKDLKSPLVIAGGGHFKATAKEAEKMYEIKPKSPKFITLD